MNRMFHRGNLIFILFQLLFLSQNVLVSQEAPKVNNSSSTFLQSKIKFDDTSLKMIILNPEYILSNPNAFWETDNAYKLVKLWHNDISFPIPMDNWIKQLNDLKNIPLKERENNPQLAAANRMIQNEKEFNNKAVPYLSSFLPNNTPSINTTIYFTTAIMASGFQMGNDIVIYGANADKDNMLIHELFHSGFNKFRDAKYSNNHKDSVLTNIYYDLQNEGMATYVGYKGLKDFPFTRTDLLKDDYKMFEDPNEIKALLNSLNNQLKKYNIQTEKEWQDTLWQIGSMDRAYYVVGCFMAETIDKQLGRDTLVETIVKRPKYFVQTYNSLVNKEMQVIDLAGIEK